jgi:ferric-dicitrate binding protein FerR (iron transport regulator)
LLATVDEYLIVFAPHAQQQRLATGSDPIHLGYTDDPATRSIQYRAAEQRFRATQARQQAEARFALEQYRLQRHAHAQALQQHQDRLRGYRQALQKRQQQASSNQSKRVRIRLPVLDYLPGSP